MGTTQTQANPPKTSVVETEHESSHVGGPVYGYGPFVPYHCNPYIAPYPGYGIMPIPFAYLNMVYGNAYQDYRLDRRPARDYGVPLDVPARKRPSLYPAIPFERSPDELRTDPQRVRFEIEVPFADAVVLFDGAKTKQTGLRRVFTSPPMAYEKEYTVTIVVQWTDQTRRLE